MLLGNNSRNRRPSWITAVVVFVVLIAIVQLVGRQQPQVLEQRFAAVTPNAGFGTLPLPPVPTSLAALARTTTARILGGQASTPVESVKRNAVLEVQIDRITPQDAGLRLSGSVANISTESISISLDAFKFTDASGTVYAATGTPPITLPPNQQAPLDLTLPIQNPTALRVAVEQPGQDRIEMILLSTAPSPTP